MPMLSPVSLILRIAAAATIYCLIVFAAGFLFGPVRVFWLEPRVGETAAALCEAPFLLAVMVLAARWVPRKFNLHRNIVALVAIGVGALVLQQVGDFAVGTFLRGITPAQQIAHFATPSGLIYLVLLVVFVVLPLLQTLDRR